MAKFNYKTGGEELGTGLLQVGGIGLTMIGSNQLLDFRRVFKAMYEKNPEAGWIKHQGAIKAGVCAGAMFIHASMIGNKKIHPLMKALYIGLMLQGAFQEARVLTTGKDGSPSPIDALGNNKNTLAQLDDLMKQAANMSGEPGQYNYTTGIGNGHPAVDLMQNASSGIGFAWDYINQNNIKL